MRYYRIPGKGNTPHRLETTQSDVIKLLKERDPKLKGSQIDPEIYAHDIPTDKAGLQNYVNDLLAHIYKLEIQAQDIGLTEDIPEADETFFEKAELKLPETAPVAPSPPSRGPDEHGLVPAILEAQIEALGEAGIEGLDKLNSHQELAGVGATFARGVVLLCVLAAGEHQLARIFVREKKRKFG